MKDNSFYCGVQVDTGRELARVTWGMMRDIISSSVEAVTTALNEIQLPGQVNVKISSSSNLHNYPT